MLNEQGGNLKNKAVAIWAETMVTQLPGFGRRRPLQLIEESFLIKAIILYPSLSTFFLFFSLALF